MTKIQLNNYMDFENLKTELTDDDGTELSFESEEAPVSFPCIAVHHYVHDIDFGGIYNIAFVYSDDFDKKC